MHCHKTGLCAQCAQPETRSCAHCARSAQVVRAAAGTAGWSCAHAPLVVLAAAHSYACLVATESPGRDTKWPNSLGQVVTSNPGCDLKQADPGRDLKVGSRLRFPYQASSQVATSFPGRDLLDDQARLRRQPHFVTSLPAQQRQTRSRLQNGGATFTFNRPGRDVNPMSRPPGNFPYRDLLLA